LLYAFVKAILFLITEIIKWIEVKSFGICMFDDWIRFIQGFIIISPLGSYSNVYLTIIAVPTFEYKYENAWYILQDSQNNIK